MIAVRMTSLLSAGAAALALLATTGVASAAPIITVSDATLQGTATPSGPFSLLNLGSSSTTGRVNSFHSGTTVDGITITYSGGGGSTVSGEFAGTNETPFASPFGGHSLENYLVAGASTGGRDGVFGTVTLTFATPQTTLDLLWGTIDFSPSDQNTITINGNVINGTDLEGHDGLNSGENGEYDAYVSITNVGTFSTVTFQDLSTTNSFEFDPGVPAATTPVPEPLSLSLFGAGLAGAAAFRRRKQKKA
jgi:hypothetical protein